MKVRRLPKNVRQGKVGRNDRKKVPQIKTRKDLRKEKRHQKKLNRFNYHNRSRKDRQENGADNQYEAGKKRGKFGNDHSGDESEEFEDEEIESDFSDEEEGKESKPTKQFTSQIDAEREKEMKALRRYEESLKSNRIKQLEAANEEDDRIIQRYEKLLKINRRKNKEGVPKSFNDGLDYALELCTDDSIRKMYEAAKEAADLEANSSDEFVEDLNLAVGRNGVDGSENDKEPERGKKAPEKSKLSVKEKNRVDKLKKIEEKYFGTDELDDLGEYDSELEMEPDEDAEDYSENDELYESDDEEEEGDEDTFSDEEDEKPQKKSKKVKFAPEPTTKGGIRKRTQPTSDSEEDEYDDDFGDESDEETSLKGVKKSVAKSTKKVSKKEKKLKTNTSDSDNELGEPAGRFVLLKPSKDSSSNGNKKSKKKEEVNRRKKLEPESDDDDGLDSDEDDDFDDDDDGLDDILDGSESDGDKEPQDTPTGDGIWEDIYGRKRDRAGNVIKEEATSAGGGKYVPPHIRAKMEAEAAAKGAAGDPKQREKLMRLKRQLKGQINRLAESNVHRISIDLDNIYMQNSRHDMNSTLTTLILEAIVVPTLTPERMVLEHMLLVAILHANVGSEVGSHFFETVVERFLADANKIATIANEDKHLDNCVQILCHLYTFDIVKCKLVHEVMQKLLECFNEKAVECILLVLRSIGFILRKDDPLALKDFIVAVQKKAANAPDDLKNDPRVKFMLDTLLAVKNNNMNKIPQYDPTLVEHFRKLLKGMISSGKYVSSLNIGLEDIINIPERGKWWLVGSAWHGTKENSAGDAPGKAAPASSFSQQLIELARQQRMNTDDRRNVFCVVMSAEDYLDAFEKLLRLAIKDLRIVASVIIHCSLAEKEYNPYYSVLAQKFCDYDRRYQLAIQYALWDRLKEIHSLQQPQVRNMARFITHLIAEGGLPLSCLKVIELGEIDKVNLRLMRQIMLGLLLQEDENKCLHVFSRLTASMKLKSFKDGIRLFMHHFLARGAQTHNQLPEEQVVVLKDRIKQADDLLSTDTRIEYDL